jgi:hypothetical protein
MPNTDYGHGNRDYSFFVAPRFNVTLNCKLCYSYSCSLSHCQSIKQSRLVRLFLLGNERMNPASVRDERTVLYSTIKTKMVHCTWLTERFQFNRDEACARKADMKIRNRASDECDLDWILDCERSKPGISSRRSPLHCIIGRQAGRHTHTYTYAKLIVPHHIRYSTVTLVVVCAS